MTGRRDEDTGFVIGNEKLPSMVVNAIVALSSKKRRAIVYAMDEHGTMTEKEIAAATGMPVTEAAGHLNALGLGGIVDRKIRKSGDAGFDDVYSLTTFAVGFLKCAVISMSRENVDLCENVLKKENDK